MSGGSWDYFCFKCDEAADSLCHQKSALRRALGNHMHLVAKAMKDIEWADSGDTAEGSDIEAIKKVLGDNAVAKEMDILIEDARKVSNAINTLIEETE